MNNEVIIKAVMAKSKSVDLLTTLKKPGKARFTPAKFRLTKSPKGVARQTGPLRIVFKNATQVVLPFSGGSTGDIPIAFYFRQTTGTGDPRGLLDFPLSTRSVIQVSGSYYLQFYNTFYQASKTGVIWKCNIIVQLATGGLGLIDPEIENTSAQL